MSEPGNETGPPDNWSETPAPAQVGQRVATGVFRRPVDLEHADAVKYVVHWAYGSSWGAVYAILQESVGQPLVSGVALTSAVMAADEALPAGVGVRTAHARQRLREPPGARARDRRRLSRS
jgi:hypothetical protein